MIHALVRKGIGQFDADSLQRIFSHKEDFLLDGKIFQENKG